MASTDRIGQDIWRDRRLFEEFFFCQFCIFNDLLKQAPSDVFPLMNRDDGRPAIGMPEENMAAPLADFLEA
jgi:hypothetical protein